MLQNCGVNMLIVFRQLVPYIARWWTALQLFEKLSSSLDRLELTNKAKQFPKIELMATQIQHLDFL